MTERDAVKITAWPNLRQPVMVCGLSGWLDGGQAATGSVRYLIKKLPTTGFAVIPGARFNVSQLPGQLPLRPHIKIEGGLIKTHRFSQNHFFYWVNPRDSRDLILFLGTEPNMHWEEYAEALLGLASDFNVSRIYFLGGVLDKTPHTKKPDIFCSCSSPKLRDEMRDYGVRFTDYEGPGSIGATILHLCQKRGIQMIRLTTRTTYYPEFNVLVQRSPRAIKTLVEMLNSQLCLRLDFSDLDGEIATLESKLDVMAQQDPRLRAYIDELGEDAPEIEPLDISATEAVEIIEDLLQNEES